jgi:DNA-binding response OmpR family regulator
MKKILVIEDQKDIREIISALLTEEGYIVFTAKNGEDGISLAIMELPELIICDILMPGIDGYSVIKELSKNNKTKAIPFIFLTAKVEKEDIRYGMMLGADDYLFKPFKTDELLNSIKSRLKRIETLKADKPKTIENHNAKKYAIEEKIFLRVNGIPHLIKICDILYVVAERQYTSLKLVDGKSYLLRRSITNWVKILPDKHFLRIHRSTIINIDFLVKMEKWYNSSYLVRLKNVPEPFQISKRYATEFRKVTI